MNTYRISLNDKAAAIVAKVATMPVWMLNAIAAAMGKENELTVGHIQQDYLSFPKTEPAVAIGCRVQTNRLRGSIRASKPVISGQQVQSAIGSNVVYAAAQEFGAHDTVTVPSHTRRKTKPGAVIGKRGPIKVRQDDGTSQVRSYQMKMNITGRGFVQRGINDRLPNYSASISKAIIDSWKAEPS